MVYFPTINMDYGIFLQTGTVIEMREDIAEKTIWMTNEKFHFLLKLYAAMRSNNVPCVIQFKHTVQYEKKRKAGGVGSATRLVFSPVGLEISLYDMTQKSFFSILKCVLRALEGIHKLGYAHQDVSWRNILYVGAEDYILIDFENSTEGDSILLNADIRIMTFALTKVC
jgi:hypothetical protein